ncbi:hypothetical protein Trydic_g17606 [Trypoxylus dichotomus]
MGNRKRRSGAENKTKVWTSTKNIPVDGNRILKYVGQHPISTCVDIVEAVHLNYSTHLVRTFLHKSGIHYQRPANKVKFSERHVASRLHIAQANLNLDCDLVIFSNEKVFKHPRISGNRYGAQQHKVWGKECP